MNFTQTSAHRNIQERVDQIPSLRVLANDSKRNASFHIKSKYLLADFTRQRVEQQTLNSLFTILDEIKFREQQLSFFHGAKINITEGRAVLHMALRAKDGEEYKIDGQNVTSDVNTMRQNMYDHANAIRSNKNIKNIILIGIGGSDLGPRFVANAFQDLADGPHIYFVSNVDEHDLLRVLKKCTPDNTLFLVASKTFTTAETMLNAKTALAWAQNRTELFYAITSHTEKALEWGIDKKNVLSFPEWVGGRFSLWSTIGFPLVIAFGSDAFDQLLNGANTCDHDFLNNDYDKNIPVLMALFGFYNRNYLKFPTHVIAPYDARLRLISKYIQQMDMESNGKTIDRDGNRVTYETAPQVYGEVGTDCQHSYFQLAHQGTDLVPVDFIGISHHVAPAYNEHHRMLMANMRAQADALAFGQTLDEANQDPFRVCEGNRPNTILTLDRFDFESLGYLIACYEHKIFTQGILWNLNSFDQPGVELGKSIALQKLKSND